WKILYLVGVCVKPIGMRHFIDCNGRAVAMFGYTEKAKFLRLGHGDLVPPASGNGHQSVSILQARMDEALRDGSIGFEWQLRRRDGKIFPVDILLTRLEMNETKVILASVRDISARKRTETAFRDSERRMADIINLLPEPVLVIDQDGCVQFWNRAMEDLTGVPATDMLGKGDYEYTIPLYGEPRPMLIDLVRLPVEILPERYGHVLRHDNMLTAETYVPIPGLRQGAGAYVLAAAAALHDSRGIYAGAVEVIRDHTERKKSETALLESERRLAHIVDFLPDATMVIDRDGTIITWNKAMADMTGVQAFDMLGKGGFDTALPFFGMRRPMLVDLVLRPSPEWEQTYTVFERRGDTLYGEIFVTALKGQQVYVMGTAAVLRNSQGQAVGAIEIVRDLTDRKRMEEAMYAAKEAAESSTRAKSEFLANMSHEIRTPMNAIIGMTSLLLNTELTAEQRELTETTQMSSDNLLALINDILDFSKIEAGRMDLESQPFDLRHCMESAVDLVAMKAAEKGLELGCLIEDEMPPTLIGDVTRLRQILVNLLNNAIKFTESGEVMVRVAISEPLNNAESDKVKPEESKYATIHFSVHDTGIGIPANRMDRLFKSFSQVDASTTRRYGGTGLGLAISARLTEIMGGRMWAESEGIPGNGSIFHFLIRQPVSMEPLEERELSDDLPELAGKQIMIVDDNPTNGLILTRQTQGWGMIPETFDSPFEALATIRRGVTFDLAILDMQMPDMDGMQLARSIRELRDAEALPLIMLTSLGRRDVGADEVGFAAFLTKPVKSAALHDALRRALGDSHGPVPAHHRQNTSTIDSKLGEYHPLRILIAEDYVINQKVAVYTLSKMGYRADVASNGLEALEALRRQSYDVVLMDMQMPEMDGLEATRRIVAGWPPGVRPRIIAMTANAMQGDRDLCLAAGMDDYIAKPMQITELQAALLRSPCGPSALPLPSAPGHEPGPAIDRATLLQFFPDLASGDTEIFDSMVELLLEDFPLRLTALDSAVAEGRAGEVHEIVHTLKGASRSFGALHFSRLCQKLEIATKNGNFGEGLDPSRAIAELRDEFNRLAGEIRDGRHG
ncbi:MAG: response regulator, partial [Rhodospirillaceae bacterium]